MGREVRRVPPNWQHPKDEHGNYIPQLEGVFEEKITEYLVEAKLWARGDHEAQLREPTYREMSFLEWLGGAPDAPCERGGYMYLSAPSDRSWWQMYENVSEGTPVSPPFATKEELEDWIVDELGHSREAAEKFVEVGSVPSMMLTVGPGGTDIKSNLEQFEPEV